MFILIDTSVAFFVVFRLLIIDKDCTVVKDELMHKTNISASTVIMQYI